MRADERLRRLETVAAQHSAGGAHIPLAAIRAVLVGNDEAAVEWAMRRIREALTAAELAQEPPASDELPNDELAEWWDSDDDAEDDPNDWLGRD